LTLVIRRSIEFNVAANAEIEDAGNNNRAINNLYELQANSIITVEEEFNNAMNRKTTNNDTHPGPSDRFRYVEGFISSQPEEGDVYVCDLFVNWDAITSEMTTDIQTRIKGS
jgi:hypothetical protein